MSGSLFSEEPSSILGQLAAPLAENHRLPKEPSSIFGHFVEGLDKIFRDAGAEWRESGCSMCIAMNGDMLQPGEYSVSLASAVTGMVTDVRTML